jgi:cephalosporin hydroxylase
MFKFRIKKFFKKNKKIEHTLPSSWRDVPGWINGAEQVYPAMVERFGDGAHFVEVGTFLGQSAIYMAGLIKDSGKKIKFETIDIWVVDEILHSHPPEIKEWRETWSFQHEGKKVLVGCYHIFKNILIYLELTDYVKPIIAESPLISKVYPDNSLDFIWLDGDHSFEAVYNELVAWYPKIKPGGRLAGDDLSLEGVWEALNTYKKNYGVEFIEEDNQENFAYWYIEKK